MTHAHLESLRHILVHTMYLPKYNSAGVLGATPIFVKVVRRTFILFVSHQTSLKSIQVTGHTEDTHTHLDI